MRKFFIIFFFFTGIVFATEFKIIAKVNDDIITQYDFDNFSIAIKQFFADNGLNSKLSSENILDVYIEEILKKQAIISEKIIFDEDEFNNYIETNNINLKTKNIISSAENYYLDIYKTSFLWSKFISTKIARNVGISNAEVNDSLEYLIKDPIRMRYNISQITMIKSQENNSETIINKLYEEINSKNNFEYIAEKFSQDSTKDKKGLIGWLDETELNPIIFDAIKDIKIGSITKPLYIGDENSGFYIIVKLNDKRKEKVAKQDDINRVKYYLYNQKTLLELKKYINTLYNNSYIEKIN